MNKLLFIGQERSSLAQERGVYWEDEAQCANQLFRALRKNKINPLECKFINLFTDESDGKPFSQKVLNKKGLNKINKWQGVIIGMGALVQKKLNQLNINHYGIIHPSARGKIRLKENYIKHISEKLGHLA